MANAVAMTGVMGAIHHISDLLKQAIASPPSESSPPHSTAPTGASGTDTIQDYTILAACLINNDEALPSCLFIIAVEMINNESLCKMYANMSEPTMRRVVVMQFYKNKHPDTDIDTQDDMVVGGSLNPYDVFE